MKQLLFLTVLFPSLLFAEGKNNFHSRAVFEENKGQVNIGRRNAVGDANPEIRFVLRGSALTYFFSDRGYSVVERSPEGDVTRMDFLFEYGQRCIPEGENKLPATNFYYTSSGNFSTQVFEKIIYRNAWQGTDLEFSVNGSFVKKTAILHGPGFPSEISFETKGAAVYPDDFGAGYTFVNFPFVLSENPVKTGLFTITVPKRGSNARTISQLSYLLKTGCGNDQAAMVGTISWMTYIGGNNADELYGIALTPDEGAVVTGRTSSVNFPTTVGSMQDSIGGSYDVVTSRFDPAGNCLWSTFYGGSNFDGAYQVISLDSTFVVAGMTNSTDLPMVNPTQALNAGGYDAFLLMLDSAGQMVRSTYYGGAGSDLGIAIAKGMNGEIVLAGSASSTDLPYASSGFQGTMNGMIDAFIAVFDDSLSVQWSTYYGGNNVEDIHAVTVTPQNEIAFVGGTRSYDFSVTPNAWQNGLLNQPDNYLVKFTMNGARRYATFFGGTNNEDANGVESDEQGNLYMSGFTYSVDFPTMGTIFQPTILGQNDVYVSKFDSTGQLKWSTYVGGNAQDVAWGMYRRGKYIYVCGQTESAAFPVSANAIQTTYATNSDGFVIKMDTSGQMVSGTFMGGNGFDVLLGIVVDSDTNVISCGNTYSTNLAITANAFQPVNGTNGDGYVVKFGMAEELIGTNLTNETLHSGSPVSVFPNPANDFVTIVSENKIIIKIEVTDALGRIVSSENMHDNKTTIAVSQLASGIYFLKVTDENSNTSIIRFVRK